MDNVEAVDVSKPFEDLTEQTPDFLVLLGQVARDQVAQGLVKVSCTRSTRAGEDVLTRFSQYSMEIYMMVR